MVKISFLGACQEVGRSAVLFESEKTGDTILCDYGTKMSSNDQNFPVHVSGKNLTAMVLTHAHIDHSGGIPLFYISGSVPLICTELTFRVTEILLQDMVSITESYLPFEKPEIDKMKRYAQFFAYNERKKVGKGTYITLYNAGHIPGSAVVLIEMDGKRLLYTGDINTTPTRLLNPFDPTEIPELDAIVTESTYGTIDHADRIKIEDEFLTDVKSVVDKKGIVVIPAFGVGRSQEMLMVLYRNSEAPYPVIVDGMARKVAYLYEKYPKMLRDPMALANAIDKAHFIQQRKSSAERDSVLETPGVIVSPSGMLKGGVSRMYVEKIQDDPNSAIFLVSYQIEATPGRVLLEKGELVDENLQNAVAVKSKYRHFDFSSHSGKTELLKMLQTLKFVNPTEKRVYCVHGEKETMMNFAESARAAGFIVETPIENQKYTL